jgi:dienelactone hydrolase
MIGAYGEWAARICAQPQRLPAAQARVRFKELLLQPDTGGAPQATLQHRIDFDGLSIEHLTWQLPYGPPTEALLLKPAGATGKRPAVLALHDHGGNKYFGIRKITRVSNDPHPLMLAHQERYYGGLAWANALARRGYVVLAADAFTFGSRRVRVADLPAAITGGLVEQDPESSDEIARYNTFAAGHEHIMAKSLFSAGTTWPGVFVAEDQRALDYLCSRPDVDAARVGCAGLSGGGLRTVYLTGADPRIKASVCAGMMTTWRDFLLNKSYTHTWMVYIPGVPRFLDYPEIAGMNAPHPFLVLNNHEDQLFTVAEMQRADGMLADVYRQAGAPDRYRMTFHPGPHKFDRDMQKEAFDWFDRWL